MPLNGARVNPMGMAEADLACRRNQARPFKMAGSCPRRPRTGGYSIPQSAQMAKGFRLMRL